MLPLPGLQQWQWCNFGKFQLQVEGRGSTSPGRLPAFGTDNCVDPYRVVLHHPSRRADKKRRLHTALAISLSNVHEVAIHLIFSASGCALFSSYRGSRFHLSRSALHVQEFPRQCRGRAPRPFHPRVSGRIALCAKESVKCNPAGNAG